MALKIDYRNDILDTSVNNKRKYRMTTNADGTVSFEDVTVYQQTGDVFGAQDINETNEAINNIPTTFKSKDIVAMTGYTKASTVAAISATDNLNTAIGKLEKTLDAKLNASATKKVLVQSAQPTDTSVLWVW